VQTPSRNFHLGLIALVGLNLLPHLGLYAQPVAVGGGICLAWRILFEFQKVALPNSWVKAILVAASCAWVYSAFGTFLGLEAGSALLILGISLKLIDRCKYHDAMVTLFLVFMLLLIRFLETQSLWITLFGAFDIVAVTALLVELHTRKKSTFEPLALLKVGSKLLLQIAPFMFLLFFVFPRFSAQFLRIKPLRGSQSGFSENMDPGDISQIALSDQVAFRVSPVDGMAIPKNRYWRGATLTLNQGLSWGRQAPDKDEKSKKALSPKSHDLQASLPGGATYDIVLEPRFSTWIFAPDVPLSVRLLNQRRVNSVIAKDDHIFQLKQVPGSHLIYRSTGAFPQNEELPEDEKSSYLQTPDENDKRVLGLVQKISKGTKSAKVKAYRLMSFYRKSFRYTLQPGAMDEKTVAEFLFAKKVGFCEHFAGSFAYIMRLADVPSRVVVGFQGAQQNEFSDYYIVRDKDAHAWTEIWSSAEKKWLRFDPTQVVAPLRIDLGGELYHGMPAGSRGVDQTGLQYLKSYKSSWAYKIFGNARFAVDLMAANWNLFLINYNRAGQKQFLSQLGFMTNQKHLLIASLLTVLLFFLWTRRKKTSEYVSPVYKVFLDLQKTLKSFQLEKAFNESSYQFLTRCQQEKPHLASDFAEFQKVFAKYFFYEKPVSKKDMQDYKAQAKELKKRLKQTSKLS